MRDPAGCEGEGWPEMDPEAARDLLADVGFPTGSPRPSRSRRSPATTCPTRTRLPTRCRPSSVTSSASTTTLKPMPFEDLVEAADAGRLDGFYLLGARARYPDASLLLESHFGPAASLQFGNRFDDVRRWLRCAGIRPTRMHARRAIAA